MELFGFTRRLDIEESHVVKYHNGRAIDLATPLVVHFADKDLEIKNQPPLDIVHAKGMQFGVMEAIGQCVCKFFERHARPQLRS